MKKVVYLIITLLVCSSMVLPVFAEQTEFVPSISYKGGPEVEEANMNGEDVADCIVVTSILEAEIGSTDISQEERGLLLEVYEALRDGIMTLGLDDDYVIRELVDVSFAYEDCRLDEAHDNKDTSLKESGVALTIDFDLGIEAGIDVIVMIYVDGQWQKVEDVTNNGDGTVTSVLEDLCPVAFVVEERVGDIPPQTGDVFNPLLWVSILILSAAALVAVVVIGARKKVW